MPESADIQTRRLVIRLFKEEYLSERYVGWLNDPEIVRYSEQRHREHTIESCRQYMNSFQGTPHFFWAVFKSHDRPEHIGNINAFIDPHNLTADIGIMIGERTIQGQGYGAEAWLGVCGFLFETQNIRKITAGTISTNIPMIRLMKKAGMVEDGIRKRHYIYDGKEVDVIHMALFKKDR